MRVMPGGELSNAPSATAALRGDCVKPQTRMACHPAPKAAMLSARRRRAGVMGPKGERPAGSAARGLPISLARSPARSAPSALSKKHAVLHAAERASSVSAVIMPNASAAKSERARARAPALMSVCCDGVPGAAGDVVGITAGVAEGLA